MARRQDSGSNSAQENQQPNPHNEDRLPENTGNERGRGESEEDAFDEDEDEVDDADDMDEDEDSYE